MKTIKLFTFILASLLMFAFTSHAEDAKKEAPKKELKHQTLCPVMGNKIDSTAYTDIQGQRIYHCCPMCTKKLKADPEKYFKEASDQGILFENIQTTCPVCGMELKEKNQFVDYVGRRIYFCSEGCASTFNKDPHKILDSMDKSTMKKDADMNKDMDMDMHKDMQKKSDDNQ